MVNYSHARYTHFYFEMIGRRLHKSFLQLDSTQIDAAAQAKGLVVDAEVLPQLDDQGKVLKDPNNLNEKKSPGRPSDHKATVVVLDPKKL